MQKKAVIAGVGAAVVVVGLDRPRSPASWLRPMREVVDGVLGSQDVNICR